MFCLSKVAAQRVFLGKSKMFQLLNSNYSQLVNKNVFWFACKLCSYHSQNYQFTIPRRFDQRRNHHRIRQE